MMTEYKQAMCMICTGDVYAPKVHDVHVLWDDEGWSGRPVCNFCFDILRFHCPEKLITPIIRLKPKKIGLEKWF